MISRKIATELGVPSSFVENVARNASLRYKTYEIAKRSGGMRQISQPSKKVKFLQRWLIRRVLSDLPVHDCATAYRKGISIRDNASVHKKSRFLLKTDFQDFFPSIKANDIGLLLRRHLGQELSGRDIQFILQVVCRYGALTIGAPSSPMISNCVLFDFDNELNNYCGRQRLKYTRYADDIVISANDPQPLERALQFIRDQTDALESPTLLLNERKTIILSKKRRRSVTGLVLTSDGKVSIGRAKKREIKALIHKSKFGLLKEDQLEYLRGWVAYANGVEPAFVVSLREKYDDIIIDGLLGPPDEAV